MSHKNYSSPSMPTKPALPPQRIDTHRTDTLAVRKLISQLSPDWIIRDLSERDYGIDLMLEYYEGNNPSGQIIFFQIKGTAAPIEPKGNLVKFLLPIKTLLYAERFPEPFLLVHTSIDQATPIYFVWIQKYIDHVLDRDRQLWRTEPDGTININIPIENTLNENSKKLIEISQTNVLQRESLKFLSSFLFWSFEYSDLLSGNTLFIPACKSRLVEFKKLPMLMEKYNQGKIPDYKEIGDCIDEFEQLDEKDLKTLADFDELLELIKTAVLTSQHQEQFIEESIGDVPY